MKRFDKIDQKILIDDEFAHNFDTQMRISIANMRQNNAQIVTDRNVEDMRFLRFVIPL